MVQNFFLTMALYPEVQRKAQAQIDMVIGQGRLPDFEDRERLPYVEATLQELFRWRPPLPVGRWSRSGSIRLMGQVLNPY